MQALTLAMIAGAIAAIPATPQHSLHPGVEQRIQLPPDSPAPVGRNCRDRIVAAREEAGLPRLDRSSPDKDEALFIAAVDRQIDGCSVLVMRNDLGDFRPLPDFSDEAELKPAQR